jgi:hypothetical protein
MVAGASGFHLSAKKISSKILRGFVKRVCAAPWCVHGLPAIDRDRTVPTQCGARNGIMKSQVRRAQPSMVLNYTAV